jgi:hypothetical protein
MAEKNKKGLPYNNLEALRDAKEHFLSLCKMYERMGKLFALQSKAMTHPIFKTSTVPQVHGRLLEQYQEVGEELKNLGTYLDLCGGKPVLKKEEPEKKTFVSNIKPPEDEEKNPYGPNDAYETLKPDEEEKK